MLFALALNLRSHMTSHPRRKIPTRLYVTWFFTSTIALIIYMLNERSNLIFSERVFVYVCQSYPNTNTHTLTLHYTNTKAQYNVLVYDFAPCKILCIECVTTISYHKLVLVCICMAYTFSIF